MLLRQLSATATATARASQPAWLSTFAVARTALASHATGASNNTNADLLNQWQKRFDDANGSSDGGGAAAVTLSLQPSSPAAPLLAGHVLFHPSDTASWLERWRQERPQDGGDPMQMLMAPEGETHKKAPLIITPATKEGTSAAALAAWCRAHQAELSEATDVFGALLFRGYDLDSLDEYEQAMEGCGIVTGDFVGTAPRAKVGKYIVRNVSFEAAAVDGNDGGGDDDSEGDDGSEDVRTSSSGSGGVAALDALRHGGGFVWAENNEQFFNFHNELAYMPAHKHDALGYANYAFFCCTKPPLVGGYTILSDARRALAKLRELMPSEGEMPTAFKFVIARKSLSESVRKQESGDYEGFLTGSWEFEQYPDQWSPSFETRQADIEAQCKQLGVRCSVDESRNDIVIESEWVPLARPHEPTGTETIWCNINHAILGKDHPLLPFWFQYADGSSRHASWSELFALVAAYWSESTFFTWQKGDMLLLHNQLVAHNASPGVGERSIMPVFGDCFGDATSLPPKKNKQTV